MQLALSVVWTLGLSNTAEASSFRRISFDELVDSSVAVVQVRVLDTESEWTKLGTGYIATTAHLEVIRSLDGDFQVGEELFVREAGGTVGDYTLQAIGFPQFNAGDELVIFLTHWEDETVDWRVAQYGQGIYEVLHKPGGDVVVPAFLQGERPDVREVTPETLIPPMTRVSDLAHAISNFR
jgi:hypothetical protein